MSKSDKYNFEINLQNIIKNDISSWFPLITLSDKLRRAFKEEIDFNDGSKIVINEYRPNKDHIVSFAIKNAPIVFAICLSGHIKVEFYSESGINDILEIGNNSFSFFYLPETSGIIKVNSNENIKIISIHTSLNFLNNLIDFDYYSFKNKIIIEQQFDRFIELSQSNFQINNSSNQLLECKFKGKTRDLFFKTKLTELIILFLEQLNKNYAEYNENISQNDIFKAKEIEKIIMSNMCEIPSLLELANRVSMTHTKLNFLFKHIYGNTVFGYIREQRLIRAKELLEEDKLNITEIAYETGWSSPSHLSKEFKFKYGITPKKFLNTLK